MYNIFFRKMYNISNIFPFIAKKYRESPDFSRSENINERTSTFLL